uniref:Protein-serine/threonine kinase n=1 Tax=Chrysotila carterae TaxID=13221 RepID=A0A7S4B9V6_CHRCT
MRDQHRPAPMASIGCVALRLLLLSATVQNVAPLARTCLSKQTRRPASQQQLTKPCMPHQLATCTKSSAFLKRAMIRMDAQSYEQPSGNMSPEITLEQLTQLTSKSLRDSVLKLMRSSRTKDAQIPRTGTSDPVLGANNLPLPEAPLLSMVELCANGQVSRFQSTLTSMHRACKLSARDVRLLRSNAPVLAVREGFILFDFGVLKGILQHDRLTLLGSDRDEVTALGSEVEKRLALSRSTLEAFEVRRFSHQRSAACHPLTLYDCLRLGRVCMFVGMSVRLHSRCIAHSLLNVTSHEVKQSILVTAYPHMKR